MSFEYIPDHRRLALRDLLSQFQRKPVAQAAIRGLMLGYQILEDKALDVSQSLLLRHATGLRLDTLGSYVGEFRLGLEDDVYREIIAARILANRSEGTRDVLRRIFEQAMSAFTQRVGDIEFEEFYPATFSLTATTVDTLQEGERPRVRSLIETARAAGVAFRLVSVREGGLRFSDTEPTFDGPPFGGLI